MESDALTAVLESPAWRGDSEAFSESTGVTVAIMAPSCPVLPPACPVCLAPGAVTNSLPSERCFRESMPRVPGAALATSCCSGLPCVLLPVPGTEGATLLVSGYLSAESERRGLVARLLDRGLSEKEARAVARATPVLRPDAAVALARLALSHLEALARVPGGEDVRSAEYQLLYEIGRGFDEGMLDHERLPELVLERARQLTGAESGALHLFAEGGTSALAGAFGERGDDFAHSLTVPLLTRDDEAVGYLSLSTDAEGGFAASDLKMVGLFAENAARALVNGRQYGEKSARVLELMELNELSRALHADAELDRVAYLVTSVLDKVLEFEVGGMLLFGVDEPARIVLRADVSPEALRELLAQVAGAEVEPRLLDRCSVVQTDGLLTDRAGAENRWTVLVEDVSTTRPEAGYLFVASRDTSAFTEADARLLHQQAAHASIALAKCRTYQRLRGDLDKLIATLSAMADAAERTPTGHAGRVMACAVDIGEELGLPAAELETLRFAGLLHDIGKLGVSEEIILKPARLTAEEMAEVRRHAEIGADIVEQMQFLEAVGPIVLHHHERWDGEGYPMGLAGEDIPLAARILAVADSFDAMTSERAYSKALPSATARVELERGRGRQFDPRVVDAFLAILDRRVTAASAGMFAGGDDTSAHLPA